MFARSSAPPRHFAIVAFAMLSLSAAAVGRPAWAEPAPIGSTVVAVDFDGNSRAENEALRSQVSTRVGRPLDESVVGHDVRSLWAMGLFDDVQVRAEDVDGGVRVVFAVSELPTLRKVYVEGNDEVGLDAINDALDLKKGALLEPAKAKGNREKLLALYTDQGYYLADIDHEVRDVGGGEVDVWFKIDEHAKIEVRDVAFIGNDHISDERLESVMATKKGGALAFLSGGGTYDEEVLERDLMAVMAYYYDHGYLNVKLSAPQVRLSRDKKYMYVNITVDEGEPYSIGRLSFEGDLSGSVDRHMSELGVDEGKTVEYTAIGRGLERISNLYRDQGYAYASAKPRMDIDVDTRQVDITIEVVRGKKVYIERINVRGNTKTRDKVIRRELKIAEGELYNQNALDASRRSIQALGFFETVQLTTSKGSADDLIVVDVQVSERPTGTFQIGAGFSTTDNFILQGQISKHNLFGRGQTFQFQGQFSGTRQLYNLRFVEPKFLDTDWTMAVDLYKKSVQSEGFTRSAFGGAMTWGYALTDTTYAYLTYRLEDVDVTTASTVSTLGAVNEVLDSSSVANLYRGGLSSSVRASISHDTRNNRLFPTEGWYASAYAEVADEFTGSESEFLRYGGFVRHYEPLFGPFVLKVNAEVGITTSRDPLGLPISERYLLGGIMDVRGFAPRSLGPRMAVGSPIDAGDPLGSLALGGNMKVVWNSEVEFPLVKSMGLNGVVFFDAGNAFNLEDRYCTGADVSIKVDPCFSFPDSLTSGLRTSVGFGVRWFSPIGPLRFEWGIPLDRQDGEDPIVFEFSIGNFF
jgi:outer membrane protein insertion porin family